MTQNTSHAVMAQRAEPHDSLDDFPTPPWAARALCEHVIAWDKSQSCWEPACNRGHLIRGLKDYFGTMYSSDIHDYGKGHRVEDFLFPNEGPDTDWIITNPPFRLAEQFSFRAFECRVNAGIALLVRTQFLEGQGRYFRLFSKFPPCYVAQFVERVPMVKGRCDPKASTATAYCWVVWEKGKPGWEPTFMWIPPCRKELERPGDYE